MRDNTKEKPSHCDSCDFPMRELKPYRYDLFTKHPPEESHKWLCSLCADTLVGSMLQYPDQFKDPVMCRLICFVGNTIIAEIKKIGVKAEEANQ